MTTSSLDMVAEFQEAFGYDMPSKPCVPGWDRHTAAEMRWFSQNLKYSLEAFKVQTKHLGAPVCMQRCCAILEEFIELVDAMVDQDMVACLDAGADGRYVNDGTMLSLGLGAVLPEAVRRVHVSNMTKLKDGLPVKDERGKVVKGDWYVPVNLKDLVP